jgi:hypothetical protein
MKKQLLIILIGLMTLAALAAFTSCSTEDVPTVEPEQEIIINDCNCPDIGIEILSIEIFDEPLMTVTVNGVEYYVWGIYTIEVDCEEIDEMYIETLYQYHQPTLDELPYHIGQCVDL